MEPLAYLASLAVQGVLDPRAHLVHPASLASRETGVTKVCLVWTGDQDPLGCLEFPVMLASPESAYRDPLVREVTPV